jgi:GGDEF domain-containing protein
MGQPAQPLPAASLPLSEVDPVTGFASRDRLIDDLDRALEPDSPCSVLAVFELAGSEEYRRVFGRQASDDLVARLAEECRRAAEATARWYRPRQDEFCAIVELPLDEATLIVEEAVRRLREEGSGSLISASFGVAVLPDEPSDAIDALIIADQHLDHRTNRERRSAADEHSPTHG